MHSRFTSLWVNQMNKITYISYAYFPHMEGGSLYTHQVANGANDRGYDVEVVTRKRSDTILQVQSSIYVKYVKGWQFKIGKYYRLIDRILSYNILLTTHNISPGVVIIHSIGTSHFFPSMYRFKKKYKLPVVTSIIEDLWTKPKNAFLPQMFFKYQQWQLKMVLKHSDVVTVPNEIGFEYLNIKYPEYAHKLKLIPGFIETNVFNPSVDAGDLKMTYEKHKIILVPQRLILSKGVDIAIQALVPAVKKYPDVKMLIAGSGPLESDLKGLVDKLNLTKHVVFLGELDHYKEMPKYYALAYIVVVPSRIEGGQPGWAAAEPMAMEKAVIISKACDIREHLEGSVLRYDTENISELSQKMLQLLSSPNLRVEMGEKARVKIIQRYSFESFTNAYQSIYDSLLQQ